MVYMLQAEADLPPNNQAYEWIWQTWFRLHRGDRPHTTIGVASAMGAIMIRPQPLPLPWTLLRAWADAYGYDEEDFELLDHCVQALDDVFFRWWAEKQKTGGG